MALHCNFQGLVAESDSDRDPGNGCFLRAPRRVCAALLPSGCYLKARAEFTWAAASAGIKQWTEHLAGTACGRANDRRWLRWRHVATRLEFCLRRLSPPFPAGLWTACQQHAIRNPGSSGPAEAPGHSDSATATPVRDPQAVHVYTPTLSDAHDRRSLSLFKKLVKQMRTLILVDQIKTTHTHTHTSKNLSFDFIFKPTTTHNQHTHVKANMWLEHQEGRGLNPGGGGGANQTQVQDGER